VTAARGCPRLAEFLQDLAHTAVEAGGSRSPASSALPRSPRCAAPARWWPNHYSRLRQRRQLDFDRRVISERRWCARRGDLASGQVRTTATTRIACNATDIATLVRTLHPTRFARSRLPSGEMRRIRSTSAQIRGTQWLALSRARCGHAAALTISAGVLRMSQGTIKRLTDKGFGFIANGTGTDMFFHMSAVEGVRFEDLREGQKVSYNEGRGPKGPRAENVRVI
jgi:cold shock protein